MGGEGDVLEDVGWRGGGAMVEEGRQFVGGGFGVAY